MEKKQWWSLKWLDIFFLFALMSQFIVVVFFAFGLGKKKSHFYKAIFKTCVKKLHRLRHAFLQENKGKKSTMYLRYGVKLFTMECTVIERFV